MENHKNRVIYSFIYIYILVEIYENNSDSWVGGHFNYIGVF